MFPLLRAALVEHRGASSSSTSKLLLLRSWPSRTLACCAAGDRAPRGGGEEAASTLRSSSPTGGGGGGDNAARAFSSAPNLVRRRLSGGASFPPSALPSPPPPLPNLRLRTPPRRPFAADAARSLQDDAPPSSEKGSSSSSSASSRLVPIPLAQTGEGLKEVEIVSWRVAVGDRVEEFGPLCDVQSDKAAVEITSRFSGVVERLCCSEGDMVEVGATLCELRVEEEEGEGEGEGETGGAEAGNVSPASPSSGSSSPLSASSSPLSASSSPPSASSSPLSGSSSPPNAVSLASPAVRRIARELGLSLSSIQGTGPAGRVLKEDVDRAAAAVASSSSPPAAASASPPASTPSSSRPEPARKAPLATSASGNVVLGDGDVVLPLRGYRRAMVSAMTASLSVPHFHFMDEYPVDRLIEARRALANDPKLRGAKLTLLPFVIKAISLALASSDGAHAAVNASLSEARDALVLHADHNIGVAIDTQRGLVVPVVRRVQDLSVAGVAAELARLQQGLLSPSGLLPEADLSGATLTVSNIGSLGGAWATPLVHPPQAAIVALGRVRPRLVLVDEGEGEGGGGGGDEARGGGGSSSSSCRGKKHGAAAASGDKKTTARPAPSPSLSAVASLPMSWGADHRVVDGAGLAKFAAAVGALLSEPARMLLHSR